MPKPTLCPLLENGTVTRLRSPLPTPISATDSVAKRRTSTGACDECRKKPTRRITLFHTLSVGGYNQSESREGTSWVRQARRALDVSLMFCGACLGLIRSGRKTGSVSECRPSAREKFPTQSISPISVTSRFTAALVVKLSVGGAIQ